MSYFHFSLEEICEQLEQLGVVGLPERELCQIKHYLDEHGDYQSSDQSGVSEEDCAASSIRSICDESTDSEKTRYSSSSSINHLYKQLSTRPPSPHGGGSVSSFTVLPHCSKAPRRSSFLGLNCSTKRQNSSVSSSPFHDASGEVVTTNHLDGPIRTRSARFAENPVADVYHLRPSTCGTPTGRCCPPSTDPKDASHRASEYPNHRRRCQHDPVSRYQAYQRSWMAHVTPEENTRKQLRWDVRNAMMHREVPLLRRNLSEVTELFGMTAAAFHDYQKRRNLSLLRPNHTKPRSRGGSCSGIDQYRIPTI